MYVFLYKRWSHFKVNWSKLKSGKMNNIIINVKYQNMNKSVIHSTYCALCTHAVVCVRTLMEVCGRATTISAVSSFSLFLTHLMVPSALITVLMDGLIRIKMAQPRLWLHIDAGSSFKH